MTAKNSFCPPTNILPAIENVCGLGREEKKSAVKNLPDKKKIYPVSPSSQARYFQRDFNFTKVLMHSAVSLSEPFNENGRKNEEKTPRVTLQGTDYLKKEKKGGNNKTRDKTFFTWLPFGLHQF